MGVGMAGKLCFYPLPSPPPAKGDGTWNLMDYLGLFALISEKANATKPPRL